MNKQTDKYGVIKCAIELMPRLTYTARGRELNAETKKTALQTLKTQYKEVETALISYLRQKSAETKTVADLENLFTAACHAFAGLGYRHDIILNNLAEPLPASQKSVYASAITKITPSYVEIAVADDLLSELDDILGDDFSAVSPWNVDNFTDIVFSGDNDYCADALVALPLIKYLDEIGCKLPLYNMETIFAGDCSATVGIIGNNWHNRALIGYFEKGEPCFGCPNDYGQYHLVVNHSFLDVFVNRLTVLLSGSKPDNADYFKVQSMRQKMYEHSTGVLFRTYADIPNIYQAISQILDTCKRDGGVITADIIREADCGIWADNTMLLMRTDLTGVSYELNKPCLTSWLDMINYLRLDDIPGHSTIADKIKSYCA